MGKHAAPEDDYRANKNSPPEDTMCACAEFPTIHHPSWHGSHFTDVLR